MRAISIATRMFLLIWRKGPYQSEHEAVRVIFRKLAIPGRQGGRSQSWMAKRLIFCSVLKRLHDDHPYTGDPFDELADIQCILEKSREADSSQGLYGFSQVVFEVLRGNVAE